MIPPHRYLTDPLVPRTPDGGIALCYDHQFSVVSLGGILPMMQSWLEHLATRELRSRGVVVPRDKR